MVKHIAELNERITLLNTEIEEQKSDASYLKAELKQIYEQIDSFTTDLKEIKEIKEIKEKLVVLEVAQVNLKNKFIQHNNSQGIKNSNEISKIMEATDNVKIATDLIFKENREMKKEVNSIKVGLESELQLLRSENELLLREHKRIYGKNRDVEGAFMHLIDEYKTTQGNKQKALTSINRSTPEKSLELVSIQVSEVGKKNLNYAKKFRNLCRYPKISDYLTKSLDTKTRSINNMKGSYKSILERSRDYFN